MNRYPISRFYGINHPIPYKYHLRSGLYSPTTYFYYPDPYNTITTENAYGAEDERFFFLGGLLAGGILGGIAGAAIASRPPCCYGYPPYPPYPPYPQYGYSPYGYPAPVPYQPQPYPYMQSPPIQNNVPQPYSPQMVTQQEIPSNPTITPPTGSPIVQYSQNYYISQ